jgi:hypothetical protein
MNRMIDGVFIVLFLALGVAGVTVFISFAKENAKDSSFCQTACHDRRVLNCTSTDNKTLVATCYDDQSPNGFVAKTIGK